MIIGSGLVATAMTPIFSHKDDSLVFAAGVSNSQCTDTNEFRREAKMLNHALTSYQQAKLFIYFSTCSIYDPDRRNSPYALHKLAMETMVASHPCHLILRLPQLAGRTPNPYTLLNYIYMRIKRGETLSIWTRAKRNIIDCMDVARIIRALVEAGLCGKTINIANDLDYTLEEIVRVFEVILGKAAIIKPIEQGCAYTIDTSFIAPYVTDEGIRFDEGYLERVLRKYYEKD
jgi:nucleoside-diphosphate-sugar epimerase